MAARLSFDDLLTVRMLYQVQPDLLAELSAVLPQTTPAVSALDLLVSRGAIDPSLAPRVRGWVERYKRQRERGFYVQLLLREGIAEERLKAFAQGAPAEVDAVQLGQQLVLWGVLDTARDHQLRFQARVALDHDQEAQVQAFLAEHPELLDRSEPAAEALTTPPPEPLEVEGAQVFEETALLAAPPAPRFVLPDWIDTTDSATGTTLGDYRLLGRIGAGGMGTVYLALHPGALERPVALKVLHRNATPETRGRFEREVLVMGSLEHPRLLELHDAGRLPDGRSFLAMEFFDGRPLDRLVEGGLLSVRRSLRIAGEVAEALAACHASAVVHRDVKPGNVLVGPSDDVRLIDFGIACVLELGELRGKVFATVPGTAVGTPRYMAPEQLVGQGLGPPADVFALGVVLYELLCGLHPWAGSENPASRLFEPPKPLREADPWTTFLPEELHTLLGVMLALEPERRPSAAHTARVLARLSDQVVGEP